MILAITRGFSSVQFSYSVVSDSLQPHGLQVPGFPVHHQLPEFTQAMSIELVMPSNHFILCHPILLLPSVFPSIRVFSCESVLHIRWPEYRSFSSYYPHSMRIEHWYVFRLGTHSVSNLKRVTRPQSHGRQCGQDHLTGVRL